MRKRVFNASNIRRAHAWLMPIVFALTAACHGLPARDSGNPVRVEAVDKFAFTGQISSLAFLQGGHALVIGGCHVQAQGNGTACTQGEVRVMNLDGTKEEDAFRLPKAVTAIAVSPDGKIWVAGDSEGRLIRSTDAATVSSKLLNQKQAITALAFSPDGKWVVSGSHDHSFPLGFMDVATGGVIKVKIRFDPVTALAFAPNGKDLAVGMEKGELAVWDFTSHASPVPVSFHGSEARAILDASFSHDGKLLAYGSRDARVEVWDRRSDQSLMELKVSSAVNALKFSPDGQYLAVGQENGKLALFELETGQEIWSKRHIVSISDLAYSPDGSTLAVAAQQHVFLYSLGEGSPEPGPTSRSERLTGSKMKGRALPGRTASFSPVSSRRLIRIMQIAQDEFLWLLPFDRLVAGSVQAMVKLVPGAAVEPSGIASAQRLTLNAGGRSLSLDLRTLEQAEGREGLREAVRTYESAQRFLLVSSPIAATSLEDAAIQGALAELGPGLRLGPWPAEGPAVRVSGAAETPVISTLPGADQGIEQALLAGRVAYLQLTKFSRLTARRVQQWLARGGTESQRQADAVVLDLRDNPGGDLESAVATAKNLVPRGHLIASVIARKNGERTDFWSDGPRGRPRSMVVLVNERTAGTAELLACALQASGAGILVGARTAGVDEVYTTFGLASGDRLRVSTGRFLCPDERSVRWKGQAVDVEVGPAASAGVVPIGVSPTDSLRPRRLVSQLGIGLPTTWDQQLRVAVDLALCLSQARPRDHAGQQAVARGLDSSASLLSVCQ
jgi:hypothetical protein